VLGSLTVAGDLAHPHESGHLVHQFVVPQVAVVVPHGLPVSLLWNNAVVCLFLLSSDPNIKRCVSSLGK